MLIVGLTGGIATGKSTVSKRLSEHYGISIVDADVIAKQVVEPGKPAYNAVIDYFGGMTPHLVKDDGSGELNREALGRVVFQNDKYLKVLNSIIHPAVRKAIGLAVAKHWLCGKSMVVLDVPLLFESNLDRFVGISLAVVCDESVQFKRLRDRNQGLSEEDALNRINSQMSLEKKRERADVVLENNGSVDELYEKLDRLISTRLRQPLWRTLLQWIPPIGIIWGTLVYYTRPVLQNSF